MIESKLGSQERSIPKEQREQLSTTILEHYYGAGKGLEEATGGKFFLVDALLVPVTDTEPIPPQKAIELFGEDRAKIEELGLNRSRQEWDSTYDGLLASQTFIHEATRTDGQQTPYEELYSILAGDEPLLPQKEDLDEPFEKFLELLSRFEPFNPMDPASIREAYNRFHNNNRRGLTKGIIETRFQINSRTVGHHLGGVLKAPEIANIPFKFRWRRENAPWKCWERGEPNGFYLDMNEAKLKDWNWAELERYPVHEYGGHFVPMYFLREEILKGNLDSVAGVIPIPDPRNWVSEGLAQTLDTLAGFELTREGKLSVALYRSNVRARTRAIFKVELEGEDLDSAVAEMLYYSPNRTADEIRSELADCLKDPLWGVYGAIYGRSDIELMTLAENLGNGMRNIVLQQMVRQPMTRNQIIQTNLGVFLRH
jgi:hypothetical protein